MRRIESDELIKILENHKHWLNEDCEDWENMRADLSHADLSNIDLSCCNLSHANLSNSDLSDTNMCWAKLEHTNMNNAYLRNTDMVSANLYHAQLSHSDLSCANLSHATLRGANLSYCDLELADLSKADLRFAIMSNSNMRKCDMRCSNILHAEMDNIRNLFVPMSCPEYGSFVGWKKAQNNLIVKLLIPADAKRSSATGRKCRCNKAVVLEIQYEDGTKANVDEVCSVYDNSFTYRVGNVVEVDNFYENRYIECAPGIHFFINRQEAVHYNTV